MQQLGPCEFGECRRQAPAIEARAAHREHFLVRQLHGLNTGPFPAAIANCQIDVVHGDRRQDDYAWLREKTSPEVRDYLEAENAYAEQMTRTTAGLKKKLYQEMVARIQETDLTVPYRRGEWLYYARTVKGLQYPIHCRRRGSMEAPEEVLLDLNELAKGHAFLAGRSYVVPEDIKSIGMDVLRHRVSLTFEAEAEERTAESLLQQIFDRIKVP